MKASLALLCRDTDRRPAAAAATWLEKKNGKKLKLFIITSTPTGCWFEAPTAVMMGCKNMSNCAVIITIDASRRWTRLLFIWHYNASSPWHSSDFFFFPSVLIQETHKLYRQKLEELTSLQTTCSSVINKQRKSLKDLRHSLSRWVFPPLQQRVYLNIYSSQYEKVKKKKKKTALELYTFDIFPRKCLRMQKNPTKTSE